jgi:hypothetical protein
MTIKQMLEFNNMIYRQLKKKKHYEGVYEVKDAK